MRLRKTVVSFPMMKSANLRVKRGMLLWLRDPAKMGSITSCAKGGPRISVRLVMAARSYQRMMRSLSESKWNYLSASDATNRCWSVSFRLFLREQHMLRAQLCKTCPSVLTN